MKKNLITINFDIGTIRKKMKDVHVVVHVLDKKWQTTAVRNNQFHRNCYESDKKNANMYFNRCDKSVNHVVFVLVLFVTLSCIFSTTLYNAYEYNNNHVRKE